LDDPALSRIAAELAAFYELRAAEEPSRDPEALLRFRKAIAAAELRADERILDLGAKWGGLASSLEEAGLRVAYTGLDVSVANADAASDGGLTFVRGDVGEGLPFDDASFDCVFCWSCSSTSRCRSSCCSSFVASWPTAAKPSSPCRARTAGSRSPASCSGGPTPRGHLNSFPTPIMQNLAALSGFRIDRRLGTSIRIPKTSRLIATNSILARSRIYVLRPSDERVFAGRRLG
jgi:hypothetical protein